MTKRLAGLIIIVLMAVGCTRDNGSIQPTQTATSDQSNNLSSDACKLELYRDTKVGFSIGYLPSWGAPRELATNMGYVLSFGESNNSDYMASHPSIDFLTVESFLTDRKGIASEEESAMALSGNQDFQMKHVAVSDHDAIEASFEQGIGPAVGSGVDYSGKTKLYMIYKLFVPLKVGALTVTYGRPKYESVPCSFDLIASTLTIP